MSLQAQRRTQGPLLRKAKPPAAKNKKAQWWFLKIKTKTAEAFWTTYIKAVESECVDDFNDNRTVKRFKKARFQQLIFYCPSFLSFFSCLRPFEKKKMSTRQENKVVFVDLTLSSDDEQDPMDTARSQHPAATTTAPTASVTVSHRSSLDDNPIISGATTRKRERSPPATAPAIPVASRSSLDTTPHDTGASFYSQPAASSASLSFQPSAAFLKRQSPLNALTTTPLTPQGDGAAEFALPLTESIRIALLANITASNATDESEDGIFRPKLKTSPFIRGPSTVTLHRRARLHQKERPCHEQIDCIPSFIFHFPCRSRDQFFNITPRFKWSDARSQNVLADRPRWEMTTLLRMLMQWSLLVLEGSGSYTALPSSIVWCTA